MKKQFKILTCSALIGLSSVSLAFAGEWKNDSSGWWYQKDDGSWYANEWQWIDGNNDGVAESYYFYDNGYLAVSTVIDNYTVNADGAWTVGNVVQTQTVQNQTTAEADHPIKDFSRFFNTDLRYYDNLRAYLNTSEPPISMPLNGYDCLYSRTMYPNWWFRFREENGVRVSNELDVLDLDSIHDIFSNLDPNHRYTLKEAEVLAKQGGASDVLLEEKREKHQILSIDASGGMRPSGRYREEYSGRLTFIYNDVKYVMISSQPNSIFYFWLRPSDAPAEI